jgi:RNA polymerase sigma-B factor
MRFVQDMTQSQIADKVGISQMHVSRLIRKALEAMRDQTAA